MDDTERRPDTISKLIEKLILVSRLNRIITHTPTMYEFRNIIVLGKWVSQISHKVDKRVVVQITDSETFRTLHSNVCWQWGKQIGKARLCIITYVVYIRECSHI